MKSAVVLLMMIGCFCISSSKEEVLRINGLFYSNYGKTVKNINVEVWDLTLNKKVDDYEFTRDFNFDMPLNHQYEYRFHKDGYISKKFSVNTTACPNKLYHFDFDMLMLKIPNNKVSEVVHVGEVSYIKKKDEFFNVPQETKKLQKAAIDLQEAYYSE